jgi:hypothetical protein
MRTSESLLSEVSDAIHIAIFDTIGAGTKTQVQT